VALAFPDELLQTIASGQAVLFTGAGFSADVRSVSGACLPDGPQMLAELWELVYGNVPPDDSSLADLYDVALLKASDRLASYVSTRLRVGDAPLPAYYAAWLGAPWRKIYTLNVDDLESAVQRQFTLPHRLVSVSATGGQAMTVPPDDRGDAAAVDVVHLNGLAADPAEALTFSTMQYAARLCGRDHHYEQLVAELERWPFVFVGTTLDEVVLWQHLELRRRAGSGGRCSPSSFLVSPRLSRARRELLSHLGIGWVQATAGELGSSCLAQKRCRNA
jgi:hypothetical protein